MITPDDHALLVNFEIVALWNPLDPRTWTAKRVMGTPEYAPPECWGMKMTHVDTRSDIYSLGATLYHALTGEQPLTAGERTSNPYRFLQVKSLNPKVGAATRDVVLKAMELPRDKRFQSAEAMSKAMQQKVNRDSGAAPPPAAIWPSYGPRPWTRRRKPSLRLVLVLALASALAILGGIWLNGAGGDGSLAARLGVRRDNGATPDATAPTADGGTAFAEVPLLTRDVAPTADPDLPAATPGASAGAAPGTPADSTLAATPTPRASATARPLGLTLAPTRGMAHRGGRRVCRQPQWVARQRLRG